MNKLSKSICFALAISCFACKESAKNNSEQVTSHQALTPYQAEHITQIETGKTSPAQLVYFACSLAGTPYHYGSIDPKLGFDCSGFVTYVFNHFGIMVPRTSADFTPVQHPVDLKDAKLGDLILFTGTDSTARVVGHMGIISSLPGEPLRFMHATSGKGNSVVETDFHHPYYEARYVKVIRIFPQNDRS
ncbi:C40 family peptidase [Mucilaginibacter paludis]|uniref:NLP/P60 protein n=1 Tax=Mucilaginibacter paludis DSM 18603 TaxID=714943 RepID=H1YG20_9SPHI|nr:C40 family peptidase [Mucilaginibacter paludis]EHQ26308.1 NLP/P60 protein [Mucilaginibacter paludis DSM 18603]